MHLIIMCSLNQQKSSWFRAIRKKQLPHAIGRKGYARFIEDMVTFVLFVF